MKRLLGAFARGAHQVAEPLAVLAGLAFAAPVPAHAADPAAAMRERYVGPDMSGVTLRRAPEWILNMILNPEEMVFNDDTAYELLAEYMTQMPSMPVTHEQAFAILEYFRLTDAGTTE